jgi:hypothetical protein
MTTPHITSEDSSSISIGSDSIHFWPDIHFLDFWSAFFCCPALTGWYKDLSLLQNGSSNRNSVGVGITDFTSSTEKSIKLLTIIK